MVIALLVILSVDLIVLVVFLAFVLGRKRCRPASPGDVKRLGSDPTIVVLKAGTATIEIAPHSDALDRVSGPFRPAEAGHV